MQKQLTEIVNRWIGRYPAAQSRITKGLALFLEGQVVPVGSAEWEVRGVYLVSVTCGYPRCSCPDFTARRERCKHIWACALATRLAALLTERATPKKTAKPLVDGLSEHCAMLHHQNEERRRRYLEGEQVLH